MALEKKEFVSQAEGSVLTKALSTEYTDFVDIRLLHPACPTLHQYLPSLPCSVISSSHTLHAPRLRYNLAYLLAAILHGCTVAFPALAALSAFSAFSASLVPPALIGTAFTSFAFRWKTPVSLALLVILNLDI